MSTRNKKVIYYFLILFISLIPICLIFSKSIWFDESYTLALIKHNYSDIVRILKLDMHPPLYFLSLKLFCDVFGYSLISTKLFSCLGFISSILLCGLILKKHFNERVSLIYSLTFLAIPFSLYFSTQQRAYSWAIFLITLCLLEVIVFLKKDDKTYHIIIMSIAGLLAAYNHFFALLAIGIIYLIANIYIIIYKRKYLKHILLSDLFIIIGYIFWIIPLFSQSRNAIGEFWVNSIDIQTIFILLGTILIITLLLIKKDNRKIEFIFTAIVVLSFQIIALLASIIIRPFYIARYAITISGVGALLIAFGLDELHKIYKRIILASLIVISTVNLVSSITFEYNSSMPKFIERSREQIKEEDVFIYFDNSFGIMSYYYPSNKHLCTYEKAWFEAFESVKCIKANEVINYIEEVNKIYTIKMTYTKIPEVITNDFDLIKIDEFTSDFNNFEMIELKIK